MRGKVLSYLNRFVKGIEFNTPMLTNKLVNSSGTIKRIRFFILLFF